jgi:hypothetical protein
MRSQYAVWVHGAEVDALFRFIPLRKEASSRFGKDTIPVNAGLKLQKLCDNLEQGMRFEH